MPKAKKKPKPPRGPCCAKIRKRTTLEVVGCAVKRAPLRRVSGMLTSVKVFLCSRHVQRADIRGMVMGGGAK